MREIKFRVFDKKIGKIFKAHDLRFTAEEAIYEVCHDTIRNDGGKHWEFTDFKEVVLMQFTGLKDKNGKEIYEGDILTYNGITSNGNKIIREVNYNAETARFQSGMYPLTQSVELSEIIGNIYENPELTQTLGFKTLMQQGRLLMYYSNLVFNFKFASFQNNFFGIFN